MKVAIIGAGISGLTTATLLKEKNISSVIFEKESQPGGLIRCNRINGSLFHICGGHVFNSKRQDVLNWFWTRLKKEEEFIKAERNAVVFMEDGKKIPYPIENHMFLFDKEIQNNCWDHSQENCNNIQYHSYRPVTKSNSSKNRTNKVSMFWWPLHLLVPLHLKFRIQISWFHCH